MDIIVGLVGLSVAAGWTPIIQWISQSFPSILPYINWLIAIGTIVIGAISAFSIYVGWSFLQGKQWAYYFTLFGYGLGIASFFSPSGIVGSLVSILMFFLLVLPTTQKFFKTNLNLPKAIPIKLS
jgi:hypothetical protein